MKWSRGITGSVPRLSRRVGFILVVGCVIALCFAVAGCGSSASSSSSSSSAAKPGAAFVGSWGANAMEENGDKTDLTTYGDAGSFLALGLNEDGTATFVIMGESESGTWTASSDTKATATFGEEGSMDLALDGDTLTASDSTDAKITFIKIDALPTATSSSSASSSSSAATGTTAATADTPLNQVILDDDYVTITVVSKGIDDVWGAGYKIDVINKTDKTIDVSVPLDKSSVNGVMNDCSFYETLMPKTSVKSADCYFYDEVASLDQLTNVVMVFEVYDDETYDTLDSVQVTL